LFYLLLVALFISLKYLLPQIRDHLSWIHKRQKDAYEHELRLVFVILIGTVLLFELIGLEAIIAGFFTGITLSTSIKSEALKNKLHAISYGFFIPIFFVTIGTKTDLMPIFNDGTILVLTITIITVSLFAKFITGWVGGKLSNFSQKESVFIGVATTPHLSTALAVAFTGHAFDLVDDRMFALMIALTLVSTLIGPLLINYAAKKL
ncbi:MAG: cation:proton antiporter, partial [Candidatus Pacebacteria bacterium]|nr:cation:proton antiporter [Candidatus Paceibacterota bacterium]